MAKVTTRTRPPDPDGDVRAALADRARRWSGQVERVAKEARRRGEPHPENYGAALVEALEAGEAVELVAWRLPLPWRRRFEAQPYSWVRVEPDGRLVEVEVEVDRGGGR